MCGIVGYVGKNKKSQFLIEKLKKLEYRGYDSAGVCNLKDNKCFQAQRREIYYS